MRGITHGNSDLLNYSLDFGMYDHDGFGNNFHVKHGYL